MLVDEMIAIVDQILLLSPKDADKELRKQRREEYRESGFLKVGMNLLEERLTGVDKSGPFLLGKQITLGDLYLYKPLYDYLLLRVHMVRKLKLSNKSLK